MPGRFIDLVQSRSFRPLAEDDISILTQDMLSSQKASVCQLMQGICILSARHHILHVLH